MTTMIMLENLADLAPLDASTDEPERDYANPLSEIGRRGS